MASKRETMLTVRTDLGATGVNTAKALALSPENSLWETRNMYSDFRGPLRKIPREYKLATSIVEPTPADSGLGESISKVLPFRYPEWQKTDQTNKAFATVTSAGFLSLSSTDTSFVNFQRVLQRNEDYNTDPGYLGEATVGFSIKFFESLDSQDVSLITSGLFCGVRTTPTTAFSVAIFHDGFRFYTSGTSLYDEEVPYTFPDDGQYHDVILQFDDDAEECNIYVDGEFVGIGPSRNVHGAGQAYKPSLGYVGFLAKTSSALETISVNITPPFVKDGIRSAYTYAPVIGTSSRVVQLKNSGHTRNHIFAATENWLWVSKDNSGTWFPLVELPYSDVHFGNFADRVILTNFNNYGRSIMFDIDRSLHVTVLDDAPPCRFTVFHKNRLWAGGDLAHPERIYFSGYRQPNKWFAPGYDANGIEEIDEVFDAGFLSVDIESGEAVRGAKGNFFGLLIVGTDTSDFQVSGSSPLLESGDPFSVQRLDGNSGVFNEHCFALVGTDLWQVGQYGVTSLQTTDKFGNIQASRISDAIQDIFADSGPEFARLDLSRKDSVRLEYHQPSGMVYLLYTSVGGTEPNRIMVFSRYSGQWYGPWDFSAKSMGYGLAGYPLKEHILLGKDGGVWFSGAFEDNTADALIRSAVIDGRSLDPLVSMTRKTWRHHRIQYIPTGNWPVTLRWRTEETGWKEQEISLSKPGAAHIGSSFKVGRSKLTSREDTHVVEVDLDCTGRWLRYEILIPSPAKPNLLATEVGFTIAGYTKE